MNKPDMILWLDDARGVYILRDFATSFQNRNESVSGVSDEDWEILEAGPDHECYWDTWSDVEQNAQVIDENGVKYRLYMNGDLWLVPEGMEYNEETDSFEWPNDDLIDD
jgi:hypothetical protein